ncbi:MAG: ABC transporter permease [Lachnospiraceae bacterium]|nr:ABC transporter permease [Lachnospiraceae bacterium]
MTRIKDYIKLHRIIIIVNVLCLVAFCILSGIAKDKAEELYSQQEAARWENDDANDMRYAQVSAFISSGRKEGEEEVNTVRASLAETITKDSYAESKSGGRVWMDAYCGETKIDIRKDNNTLSTKAVGIGGDFFQFHPMKLLAGSYIAESDLNHDRIVVDENFAWAMFGSTDIVGMQVWIGNNVYFVAGVVAVDEDKTFQMAYGDENRVYMCFDELKKNDEELCVTCYEAVYPNPISNYAYNALRKAYGFFDEDEETLGKEKNPLSFDNVDIIENTKRYQTMELITGMKMWKYRGMRTSGVGYPYWENIARVQDDEQRVILIFRGLMLVCPIISLILLCYNLWHMKTWTIKGLIKQEIEEEINRRAWRAYEAQNADQEEEETDDTSDDLEVDEDEVMVAVTEIDDIETEYTENEEG